MIPNGTRVRIRRYNVTPMFDNETGVVTGYTTSGKFCTVLLDRWEFFKCPEPKWINPQDLEVISE